MRRGFILLQFLLLLVIFYSCSRSTIGNETLSAVLADDGSIADLAFGQGKDSSAVTAYTMLAGCKQVSDTRRTEIGERILFERFLEDSVRNRCKVTDIFTSSQEGIIWEIEIQGEGDPWSTPIETVIKYPVSGNSAFWTTWSAMEKSDGKWCDPLIMKPFEDLCLNYGGGDIMDPNSLVIPMFSIFEKDKNAGFSLVQSVKDTLLNMKLITTAQGDVILQRENHKISKSHTIRFKMHLLSHTADWRAGLGFCVKTYPQYFEPVSSQTHQVAGCGAYSSWEGELDTAKLNQMAFRFNWKATFDFPYIGLFLPEVSNYNERWERFHQRGVKVGDGYTSVNEMEGYMKRMKDLNYHVLCYFNLTEVGNHIVYPAPTRKAKDDNDLWRDPNDFIYYTDVRKALLKRAGAENDSPVYSNWEGCVVVDPGEESYKKHLLTQAKRHLDYLPSHSGFCIDRLDWLREYNVKGNDGVSWKDNVPSRALILSWKEIMSELGPMLHDSQKVIFANVLTSRIDVLEHIDAIYDEYGQIPLSLNRSAFMTLKKPLIAWTASIDDFKPDPDMYFQRHLYLGSFLTIPYPGNDHTILPDPGIEAYYMDYGNMLSALDGKQWVLVPNVLKIEQGEAKANIFENKLAYQIPVVLGKDGRVTISLAGLNTDYSSCRILYPGKENLLIEPVQKAGRTFFDVPLVRGCGMLVIDK